MKEKVELFLVTAALFALFVFCWAAEKLGFEMGDWE